MKLSQLCGETFDPDPEILGLTADSRNVEKGFLFAALRGVNADGSAFIAQAEKNGAAAVLGDADTRAHVPVVTDPIPRQRFAKIAARFYPKQPAFIAGITGTNGKTSTARFAAQLWSMLKAKSGSIGTLGADSEGYSTPLRHTTPGPVELHKILDRMKDAGTTHLAMEVSSHGLSQHRADGVRFSIAAFTNLTQDHLDFHANFSDYFSAKKRLFDDLLPEDGIAVVNADGAGASEVCDLLKERGIKTLTTGKAGHSLTIKSSRAVPNGLAVEVYADEKYYSITLPLVGSFQVENALLATGVAIASGFKSSDVIPLLEKLKGVPGRMEHVADANGASVYVDYAHTPAAVEMAIQSLRPHFHGQLVLILGAGGERDQEKRSLMGKAALAADHVIVTDDNPRHEDPAAIRRQLIAGVPNAKEIADRAEAIQFGVSQLKKGDVLLVAGKGHEEGQIYGDEVRAFNDGDVVRESVNRFSRGG